MIKVLEVTCYSVCLELICTQQRENKPTQSKEEQKMKNDFAREYAEVQRIRAVWKVAKPEEKEQVRAEMEKLQESIAAKGEEYSRIYKVYEDARDKGNEYIDFNEVIWNADDLVETLKELGIEAFTFSSRWSSAVETAWVFQKHGYKIQGMVEVTTGFNLNFETLEDEAEKGPAYLFKLN